MSSLREADAALLFYSFFPLEVLKSRPLNLFLRPETLSFDRAAKLTF